MKLIKDPRMKIARKTLIYSWIFYSAFMAAVIISGASLKIKPYIFGLPAWAAVSIIFIPVGFVLLLILVINKLIPDISLEDTDSRGEEE
ncbi:DUF997 family protein [Acidobacteriota bacterium]